MNIAPAPRRPVGLPSNPRHGQSLKHTKSQPDIGRTRPPPVTNQLLPTRGGVRPREASGRHPIAGPSRVVKNLEKPEASPAKSESALPSVQSSLRNTSNRSWTPAPSSRTRLDGDLPMLPPVQDAAVPSNGNGDGESAPLWKKMATLLTVNMGKALASNIGIGDGEATPVGAESRLTKAMKSYYLSRARDHSDLPEWLFDDTERRAKPLLQWEERKKRSLDDSQLPLASHAPGHRTHYSQDSRAQETRHNAPAARTTPVGGNAGDRLKAMRERQRNEKPPPTSRLPVGRSST